MLPATLADLGGGACRAHAPLWEILDPPLGNILSLKNVTPDMTPSNLTDIQVYYMMGLVT